jgi:hypothetical protein
VHKLKQCHAQVSFICLHISEERAEPDGRFSHHNEKFVHYSLIAVFDMQPEIVCTHAIKLLFVEPSSPLQMLARKSSPFADACKRIFPLADACKKIFPLADACKKIFSLADTCKKIFPLCRCLQEKTKSKR